VIMFHFPFFRIYLSNRAVIHVLAAVLITITLSHRYYTTLHCHRVLIAFSSRSHRVLIAFSSLASRFLIACLSLSHNLAFSHNHTTTTPQSHPSQTRTKLHPPRSPDRGRTRKPQKIIARQRRQQGQSQRQMKRWR
jgi:hypothetical protein